MAESSLSRSSASFAAAFVRAASAMRAASLRASIECFSRRPTRDTRAVMAVANRLKAATMILTLPLFMLKEPTLSRYKKIAVLTNTSRRVIPTAPTAFRLIQILSGDDVCSSVVCAEARFAGGCGGICRMERECLILGKSLPARLRSHRGRSKVADRSRQQPNMMSPACPKSRSNLRFPSLN